MTDEQLKTELVQRFKLDIDYVNRINKSGFDVCRLAYDIDGWFAVEKVIFRQSSNRMGHLCAQFMDCMINNDWIAASRIIDKAYALGFLEESKVNG